MAEGDRPVLSDGADRIEQSEQRHRPLLTATIAFGAGILAADLFSISAPATVLVGIGCAALLVLGRRGMSDPFQSAVVLLLVAAAGAASYACRVDRARHQAHRSVAGLVGDSPGLYYLAGTVRGEPTVRPAASRIETDGEPARRLVRIPLDAEAVRSGEQTVPTWGEVAVTVSDWSEAGDTDAGGPLGGLGHGDRVEVFGRLSALDPDRPEHGWATSRGIAARMWVGTPRAVRLRQRHPGSVRRLLDSIKQSFRNQIDAHFSGDIAVILKVVLLGDRELLGRGLAEMFEKSGTMHVLSISGLHVGIVYLAAMWLCRMLLLPEWRRRVIVLAAVLAYATTTGFRPATSRAVLMIVLFELGLALRLSRDPVNAVAAAALILLVFSPHQLFEAGFQLTFVAVLGILMFVGPIKKVLAGKPGDVERLAEPELLPLRERAWQWTRGLLAGALGVCIAATCVVMPLQAHYFQVVTPVSVVATALLFPVLVLLITSGFAFLLLASVSSLAASPLVLLIGGLAAVFQGVVRAAGQVPLGHAYVAPPASPWVWALYGGMLVVAVRRWLRIKGTVALVVPTAILCVYLVGDTARRPGPDLAATVVDVGHGTSVALTRGRQVIVYDCGSGRPISTYDVGRGAVAHALWDQGIKRIDLLILSHSHTDHINGVVSLVDRFPVGRVLVPACFGQEPLGAWLLDELDARGVRIEKVSVGKRLTFGDFHISVLWPPKEPGGWALTLVNDRSLVARVESGGHSVLLTGDVEQVGMGALLATRDDLEADLLYVPHHGADEPVLGEFVETVAPSIAVISSARRSSDELRAVQSYFEGIPLYQTWRDGSIRATATDDGWQVQTER